MTAVLRLLALLSADRQSVIILAFWTLVGAGVIVSVGAWILLRRESSAARPPKGESVEEPSESEPAETDRAEAGPASV